jgi:GNAT superfamily N-acetyltransferase
MSTLCDKTQPTELSKWRSRAEARRGTEPVTFEPANYHIIDTPNDGCEVEIRAQRPEDRRALLAAVQRASTETMYRRFLVAKRELSEQDEHFFLDVDFVNHVVLVAEATEDERPVIVGGCRYIVIEPGKAEVAFSVIDAYQKKGLGGALMRHIAAIWRCSILWLARRSDLHDGGVWL